MSGTRSCCGARRSPWSTWRIPTALGATTRPDPAPGVWPGPPGASAGRIQEQGGCMMESVIGLLTDRGAAQRLRSALVEAGCAEQDVVIFDRSAGEALAGELVERGLEQGRARLYAQAGPRGGLLGAAEAEKADQPAAGMNRLQPAAPENVAEGQV